MKNKLNTINFNNGFTLLEVMIAMVIFAVGMLGLAGIQSISLQNEHASYSRSQAILLAYEMADKLKANPGGSINYVVDANTTTIAGYSDSTMCTANNCTITNIVDYDIGLWKEAVSTLLPGGQASITNPTPLNHTITVHWDEDRTGVTGTNCPVTGATDLRCFQLSVRL